MAGISTGVSLLATGFIASVFDLSVVKPSTVVSGGSAISPVEIYTNITNSGYDAGFGTLSNTTYTLSNTTGNGVGGYSQVLQNSVTSSTNTLNLTLTHGGFAWRETDVTITVTSSTGATRVSGASSVRTACNYSGTGCSYPTNALNSSGNTKVISYTDPFNGATTPSDITVNGVTVVTYNSNTANDFTANYTGELAIVLKYDRLGTYSTSLNHAAFDSWGLIGVSGGSYSVTATRNLQWYGSTSYSKTSNGVKVSFTTDGRAEYRHGGTSPVGGTYESTASWIGNRDVADILDGSFIRTPSLYQIKVSHISGDTSWDFSRVGGSWTPLNKDQWYDMSYNSSYPNFVVNLTSNNVVGVYTSVVNIQIRNMANTVSYSQNITLSVTDIA